MPHKMTFEMTLSSDVDVEVTGLYTTGYPQSNNWPGYPAEPDQFDMTRCTVNGVPYKPTASECEEIDAQAFREEAGLNEGYAESAAESRLSERLFALRD